MHTWTSSSALRNTDISDALGALNAPGAAAPWLGCWETNFSRLNCGNRSPTPLVGREGLGARDRNSNPIVSPPSPPLP